MNRKIIENKMTGEFIQNLPRFALSPVPLFVIEPVLKHIANFIVKKNPDIFSRLGQHINTIFVINPTNMPFIIRLIPNPEELSITVHRRSEKVKFDASITGTFLTMVKMIDGGLDGDALFFTRDLKLEGNTEAIVCLRNAMDDLDGSIVDDMLDACGPLAKPLNRVLEMFKEK